MRPIYLTLKIEDMNFPVYKKFKCSKCKSIVGVTKTSYKEVLKKLKNPEILCGDCFENPNYKINNFKLRRPTLGQIKEMRILNPNLDEIQVRGIMNRIKKLKEN